PISKWIKGMFSSYNLDAQLTEYDNNAVSVSVAGYFIGVTAIFIGAFSETSPVAQLLDDGTREVVDIALDRDTLIEFLEVAGYSLAGVFLLLLARLINQKMILTKFSVDKEIIGDQNPGTGVVEGATYVASGLIIGGAVHGEGGGPITALVFYLLGQLCLVLFAQLYAKLTPYDLHDEIEKDNTAAGLGFAGGLISIGVIVMRAVSGNFSSWAEDLATLGFDILIIFVYLIAIRFIFDRFVVRNSNLNTEIAEDHNLGAGLLEMVVSISFSAVLYFVL
ncbi:MAG: DUF350 domain-containing protein, partial [Bacteroidota bacterium]